jgi:plastocyanin
MIDPRRAITRTRLTTIALVASGTVLVGGCGDDASDAVGPARSIAVNAFEYSFSTTGPADIAVGETIRFVVTNTGGLPHQMEVLDGGGTRQGRTGVIAPGDTDEVVVTFEEAGLYQAICDVDDHLSRGQRVSIAVDG